MTTSSDLAAALEAFIREAVDRRVDERLETMNMTPLPEFPVRPQPWLNTVEAAARAGRHERTVADACRSGELAATQRGPNSSWRIRPEAVDAWLLGEEPGAARASAGPSGARYLDVRGAAIYAHRSEDWIRKSCQSGELFATQRVRGGKWSIRPASLDSWLDGSPNPHREQVERWQRGPQQPLKPRLPRWPLPATDPEGPAAA